MAVTPEKGANLTGRIFLKLILGVFGVLIVALTAVDFLASRVAESTHIANLTRNLEDKNQMLALSGIVAAGEARDPKFYAQAHAAGGRLTVIRHNGHVIADSEANASQMENHARRPEFVQALHGTTGSEIRLSHTMGVKFLYVASPIPEGAVRLAVPLKDVDAEVAAVRNQLLAAVAVAFVPAIILAAFFARHVSARLGAIIAYAGKLARGEFEARLPKGGRDELGLLVEQLNDTGEKLENMFQELQREHAELEKLERVRKDFVINVSHELRTPLASIQGYTETLLDGAIDDPDHNVRFLRIIRSNAERLARLTADLMTLSRLELKSTRFQFASYYVAELLADCVDSMAPMAEKKHVTLVREPVAPELEVFCDTEAVHQVVSNLLDNALKYTPEGGSIFVSARDAGGDPDMIEFSVRDTGIGIPAEDQPRLFERFYRVDKARSREMGGTGLGLAIVKHLVRAQGGSVRVESEMGKGAAFLFTLPAHDIGLQDHGAAPPDMSGVITRP